MKLLLTTIAAVVLVGCGPQPLDISIHEAALAGNIEAVKQAIADGADVNAKDNEGKTPLDYTTRENELAAAVFGTGTEIADPLRKHGGKTRAELKAEDK